MIEAVLDDGGWYFGDANASTLHTAPSQQVMPPGSSSGGTAHKEKGSRRKRERKVRSQRPSCALLTPQLVKWLDDENMSYADAFNEELERREYFAYSLFQISPEPSQLPLPAQR